VTETRRHRPEEAREVLAVLEDYRRRFRRDLGASFVYPSDEFYLLAGAPFPAGRYYDGYPQFSNGVGMVRSLLDELAGLRRRKHRPRARVRKATLFTGTLAAPVLASVFGEVGELVGCELDVVPIENRYFGPSVTVAGLLTGGDVRAGLRGRPLGEIVIAPRYMLDTLGARFLDDVTPVELEAELGRPLRFAANIREALEAIE
jgi:NifB/MoaA-like Fe-S oxidoreductase